MQQAHQAHQAQVVHRLHLQVQQNLQLKVLQINNLT